VYSTVCFCEETQHLVHCCTVLQHYVLYSIASRLGPCLSNASSLTTTMRQRQRDIPPELARKAQCVQFVYRFVWSNQVHNRFYHSQILCSVLFFHASEQRKQNTTKQHLLVILFLQQHFEFGNRKNTRIVYNRSFTLLRRCTCEQAM